MKVIFDFDDTIFDTKRFKEECVFNLGNTKLNAGDSLDYKKLSTQDIRDSYTLFRSEHTEFILKDFLEFVEKRYDLKDFDKDLVIFNISKRIPDYIKLDYKNLLQSIGRENVFIVSQGDHSFQTFKLEASDILNNVIDYTIVEKNKREKIEEICLKWSDEEIVFVDDKVSNLIFENGPANLKQIFVGDFENLSSDDKEKIKIFKVDICERPAYISKYFNISEFEKIRMS